MLGKRIIIRAAVVTGNVQQKNYIVMNLMSFSNYHISIDISYLEMSCRTGTQSANLTLIILPTYCIYGRAYTWK